ncbi:hypothetical protein Tco_0769934, partial [Tanacetum coccineum]
MSEIKQVDQYAQALSSIPAIVDRYMDNKLREAINKAILAHNLDCRQEAQDEKNAYIELVDTSMRDLIMEEKLYDALVESYNTDNDLFDSYGEVFSLKRSRDESDKDRDPSVGSDRGKKRRKSSKDVESSRDSSLPMQRSQVILLKTQACNKIKKPERPPTPDPDWSKRQQIDFRPPQTWISQVVRAEEPPISFDELNDTSFDFYAFVMNRLKILNLTQEVLLVGPAFNLLKGTCKSITELEYHLEECSKATTERLDWHNPKNKPYPFNLRKPLLLIQYHRGRQIIPQDYFINKDLEYLKGEDLSRRYSTSVTKTKAVTYDLKWIEDLVYNLWSLVQMEDIEVRRDDQKLYTFKEGDFKRLHLQDIEDMLLLLVQQKLTNLTIDERYDLNVAL